MKAVLSTKLCFRKAEAWKQPKCLTKEEKFIKLNENYLTVLNVRFKDFIEPWDNS